MTDGIDLVIEERLTAYNAAPLWRAIRKRLSSQAVRPLVVDASRLVSIDSVGVALLFDLTQIPHKTGCAVEVRGLAPKFVMLVERHVARPIELPPLPERPGLLEQTGAATADALSHLSGMADFVARCSSVFMLALRGRVRVRWGEVFDIATEAGANAVPIVLLVGFLMGIIIAFEIGVAARQFGVAVLVVDGIGIAMLRELGPLMTAIVFAGRTGVTFSAEIGTRKVNEEVNAITTFGLDPIEFLVLPRVIAGIIAVPLLTILADIFGILGGAIVMAILGVGYLQFYNQLITVLAPWDFGIGIVKAAVYGLAITAICCERGLATGAGAIAVGLSVRGAVVASIVMIVVINVVFTLLAS
jgi:phospholipid/cholesterol/gamma-HCH transport system permease protein